MLFSKIKYYFKRLFELGLAKSVWRIKCQLTLLAFAVKKKLLSFFITDLSPNFLSTKKSHKQTILNLKNFFVFMKKENANFQNLSILPLQFEKDQLEIFSTYLAPQKNNWQKWHTDWTTKNNPGLYSKKQTPFFWCITPKSNAFKNFYKKGFDIKVCWELTRMQIFSYKAFWQHKKKDFFSVQGFSSFWQSFSARNQYLYGLHWINPMEVGIRSVNLLWIMMMTNLPKNIHLSILNSLQKHKEFIENNLETSTTPNNHFLADLVSLCYLNAFLGFDSKENLKKIFSKTWQAFLAQLLPDNTFYEGSSCYHKLNLEMMLHLSLLDKFFKIGITDLKFITQKVSQLFLSCSTPENYLKIGDNDSGKFVFGVEEKVSPKDLVLKLKIDHYPNFGLIIIKNQDTRISLRYKIFNPQTQPSGHFHYDNLSITFTHKGKPIIIEPGTSDYSGNTRLRRFLRGFKSYSTFFSTKEKLSQNLFFTESDNSQNKVFIKSYANNFWQIIKIIGTTRIGDSLKLIKRRKIVIKFDLAKKAISNLLIQDKVFNNSEFSQKINWNFLLAQNVELQKTSPKNYSFFLNKEPVFISSSICLTRKKGFFAPGYKKLVKTNRLTATISDLKQKSSKTASFSLKMSHT